MNVYKQHPDDPFVVFCICMSYVHLISQKFTLGKNSLVIQVSINSLIDTSTKVLHGTYSKLKNLKSILQL